MSPQPGRPSISFIRKALAPAVRLWLRSQVESVEELDFQIEGSDRQILAGCIPKVAIGARRAVYQGLHLSQIELTGENIRINLGQILQGKSLRLLSVVPISGSLAWEESDLNASLQSPLFANAVAEFFLNGLKESGLKEFSKGLPELVPAMNTPGTLQAAEAVMSHRQLTLKLKGRSPSSLSITLQTRLSLVSGNRLRLEQPHLWADVAGKTSSTQLEDYEVELGTEVELRELRLELGKLWVKGQINVLP
ncbi:MAG: DUF2993 domain-containing protein [Leptolyngbyaceae cyanobacterium CSU_1_4]|nr:DUF2993 domain-containing protein [Leptolyngbyaceae cyanobacterium CSU_1_4]